MIVKNKLLLLVVAAALIVVAIVVPSVLMTQQETVVSEKSSESNPSNNKTTLTNKAYFSAADIKIGGSFIVGTAGVVAGALFSKKASQSINMDAHRFSRLSRYAKNATEFEKRMEEETLKIKKVMADKENDQFKSKAVKEAVKAAIDSLATALNVVGAAVGVASGGAGAALQVAGGVVQGIGNAVNAELEREMNLRAAEFAAQAKDFELQRECEQRAKEAEQKKIAFYAKMDPLKNLKAYQASAGSGFTLGALGYGYAGMLSLHRNECLKLQSETSCEANMYCIWKGAVCSSLDRFAAVQKFNKRVCAVQSKDTCGKESVSSGCVWSGRKCSITIWHRVFGSLNRYWLPDDKKE